MHSVRVRSGRTLEDPAFPERDRQHQDASRSNGHEQADSNDGARNLQMVVGGSIAGGELPTVYQGVFSAAREGLKVVPVFNMAQATLRRRSAIDRRARPWL